LHSWIAPLTLAPNPQKAYTSRIMNLLKNNLTWYLKWASTAALISGMLLTALNVYPLNMYLSLSGVVGWLAVGFLWHDRSVIVLNTVGTTIYVGGIISTLID
jgi:hypothetical protein